MLGLKQLMAGTLLAATVVSSLALSGTAQASSKGRKNTAIALGALTAIELLNGKTTNAVVAGAATAYAYKRYQDEKKIEDRDRYAYRYRGGRYGDRYNDRYSDRYNDRYDSRYDNRYDTRYDNRYPDRGLSERDRDLLRRAEANRIERERNRYSRR